MPIRKVLIVDDSRTELVHLGGILRDAGFEVDTAQDADEAQNKLDQSKPDLVLMDVVMPGKNGFQLTRSITRDPRYADMPVILCTSKNQEVDRVWGLRQGARDYLVKPIQQEDLLSKIKALG
jgi:twitching motility two-component system response regulator PilH